MTTGGLFTTAAQVQDMLGREGFHFCFIGGLALQRWGEPRFTRDIDLSLLCPYGGEAETAARLGRLLSPRIPDAVAFSVESRVFLAVAGEGTPVDIAFAAIDFERRCLARASVHDFGGPPLATCSAEDLVVMKAFAGRPQDWVDLRGILVRQGEALDWGMIEQELPPLLAAKDDAAAFERLARLREDSRRAP